MIDGYPAHPTQLRGLVMSQSNETAVSEITIKVASPTPTAKSESTVTNSTTAREATKDAGRVRMGAGMMRF
jgi:hypothetical protein